jgi:hypothetical protein
VEVIGVRPSLIFLFTLVGLWAATWIGLHLRRSAGFDEEKRQDFGIIQAAMLTLLGLLIGFSFSMAASRYDQRKNLEEAEANAIGTEYARADLLVDAGRTQLRELLRTYTDLRIRYYEAAWDAVPAIDAETAKVQGQLWAAVVQAAGERPTPITALAVAGMNDVLNAQGYTQAAWWNRIPFAAQVLVAVVAVLCSVMIGYGARSVSPRSPLFAVLPLFVAIAFALITDIDSPRHGLINVKPQNLVALQLQIKG